MAGSEPGPPLGEEGNDASGYDEWDRFRSEYLVTGDWPMNVPQAPYWRSTVDDMDDRVLDGSSKPPSASAPKHQRRCPEGRGRKSLPGMIKTTEMGKGMEQVRTCPTCDGVGYVSDGIE